MTDAMKMIEELEGWVSIGIYPIPLSDEMAEALLRLARAGIRAEKVVEATEAEVKGWRHEWKLKCENAIDQFPGPILLEQMDTTDTALAAYKEATNDAG